MERQARFWPTVRRALRSPHPPRTSLLPVSNSLKRSFLMRRLRQRSNPNLHQRSRRRLRPQRLRSVQQNSVQQNSVQQNHRAPRRRRQSLFSRWRQRRPPQFSRRHLSRLLWREPNREQNPLHRLHLLDLLNLRVRSSSISWCQRTPSLACRSKPRSRDVRVGDRVAIPAGSQAKGEVTMVERGGKVKDKARLGVRFTSVVLADGTRVPLETDTIYREGDSPTAESTAKIGGGAIGGAILGGIFGGAKGAAIGAATGAGAGTAAVVAGGRNAATLPSGTPVTVRLIKPATVTVED
ncbi:MAG: hypothetical protein DMF88_13405 [Acidobacteria bacterium]|nr:MAG: hypothetical protein DMF88_13405 [Acidobacteriota bacterium]